MNETFEYFSKQISAYKGDGEKQMDRQTKERVQTDTQADRQSKRQTSGPTPDSQAPNRNNNLKVKFTDPTGIKLSLPKTDGKFAPSKGHPTI